MPRYAFATSEDAARVTAIDVDSLQPVSVLSAAPGAHSLALTPDMSRLYVLNRRGRSITAIDPTVPAVIDTIPLESDPLAGSVSPDGRWLAVLGRTQPIAWLFDAVTGAHRATIPLAPHATAAAPPPDDAGPPVTSHPVWMPDGRTLIAEDQLRSRLVRIDAATAKVTGTLSLPSPAHMLYVGPDGRGYALCAGIPDQTVPPSVAVFTPQLDRILADRAVPLAEGETGELHHACFSVDGGRLFVANMGRGRPRSGRSVFVLDTDTLEFIARLEALPGAGHPRISPDGRRLFVVNHGSPVVSVFDPDRLTPVGAVLLPGARQMGHGCSFTDDGAYLWTVSSSAGLAFAIDTGHLTVAAEVEVGPNCQDIALAWGDASA